MAVTYSGSASVHHSSDTNASSAAQLRFSGASSNTGAAVHADKAQSLCCTQHQRTYSSWPALQVRVQPGSQGTRRECEAGAWPQP